MILTRYWSNAILLLTVIAPIALADSSPVHGIATVVVVALGWLSSLRKRPIYIPEPVARVIIVIAFGYLMAEYVLFDRILVMALSQFLITVCLVRLLQQRGPREDAQIVVLCLMLLVVGAIVSGSVSFVIAVAVVMTVGVSLMIQLHMEGERDRTCGGSVSEAVDLGFAAPGQPSSATGRSARASLRRLTVGMGLSGILIGVIVFLACPRLESSFIRQFQSAGAGPVLTGFSSSMEMRDGQSISPSERPVMRVVISNPEPLSLQEQESEFYFRGAVSPRYGRRTAGLGAGWGWQRTPPGSGEIQTIDMDDESHRAVLGYADTPQQTIEYQFWLEPGDYSNIFTPYPLLHLVSRDFSAFRFDRANQTVRISKTGRLVRYSATSVSPQAAYLIRQHGDQPANASPPPLVVPEIVLPRADDIIRSIDDQVGDFGSLDVPANREAFLDKLEAYLRSPVFTYSLTLPSIALGSEPIGEFLLNTRQGHCEYFASAMVVVCQLKGIQARYVTGYRGGDVNPVGGFMIVRQKHAHAWVEAYVPGKGWVTYDPTPGASRVVAAEDSWFSPARTVVDFLQFQWANLVVAYDASARQQLIDRFHAWLTRPAQDETTWMGAVVAFVRELFSWRLEMSTRDRVLYWVFALLVVILTVLLGYMLIRGVRHLAGYLSRWLSARRHRGTARPEAEFYFRFCRRLEAMGFRRSAGQTPAEFANQLATRHPAFAAAPELVRIYYSLVFGNRALSSNERDWVQRFMSELNQADSAGLRA